MTWQSMRKRALSLALAAVLTVTLTVPASAAIGDGVTPTYDEAYYVTLDYYGNLLEGSMVKSYAMNGKDSLTDYGVYDEVVNLTDNAVPERGEGGTTTFRFSGGVPDHFYFEGKTKKPFGDLPWSVALRYTLNGVPAKAEDLAGKQGVVEILLDIVPNENAGDYARYNYTLAATALFNQDDILSLEAEGAQVQLVGNLRTVLFLCLPGEEQHFTIRVGSDDFSFGGLTVLMVPATLAQLEEIAKLSQRKDDLEEDYRRLSGSLDNLLDALNDIQNGLYASAKGLDQLEAARKTFSGGKGVLYDGAGKLRGDLSNLADLLEPVEQRMQALSGTVTGSKAVLNEMADAAVTLQGQLDELEEALWELENGAQDLKNVIRLAADMESSLLRLERALGGSHVSTGSVATNSRALVEKVKNVHGAYATKDQEEFMLKLLKAQGLGDAAAAAQLRSMGELMEKVESGAVSPDQLSAEQKAALAKAKQMQALHAAAQSGQLHFQDFCEQLPNVSKEEAKQMNDLWLIYNSGGSTSGRIRPPQPETPKTPGTTDTTDGPKTPGTTDATDDPKTPGTTDTVDGPKTPGTADTTDDPKTPGTADTTDDPKTPGTADTTDDPKTPGTTDTTDDPKTPGTADTTDDPKTPGATDTTDGPKTPGATDTTDDPKTPGTTDTADDSKTPGTTDTAGNTDKKPPENPDDGGEAPRKKGHAAEAAPETVATILEGLLVTNAEGVDDGGSDSDGGNSTAGDTSSGDTSSGNTSSGDTISGDTSSRDTSSGDTSSGDTSSVDTSSGDTTSGTTGGGTTEGTTGGGTTEGTTGGGTPDGTTGGSTTDGTTGGTTGGTSSGDSGKPNDTVGGAVVDLISSGLDSASARIDAIQRDLMDELNAVKGPTSTVVGRLADLCGELDILVDDLDSAQDLAAALRKSSGTLRGILEDADALRGVLNDYEPTLQEALANAGTLSASAVTTIRDTEALIGDAENLARSTGKDLDAGTKQSLAGLSAALRQTAKALATTKEVKDAKKAVTDIIEDTWNEYTGDVNNILMMDATAEAVSLTDSRNPAPTSVQVLIRTQEIKEEKAEEDQADSAGKAPTTFWGRVAQMFKDFWKAVTGIFR